MKKRLLVLTTLLVLSLTACGSKTDDTEDKATTEETTEAAEETTDDTEDTTETDTTPITDKTVEEAGIDAFVSVGEYKGLELTRTVSTITDQDVEDQIASNLSSNPVELAEGIAEDGDTVNINFIGYLDDEKQDDMTDESEAGTDVVIGSGSMIDGFEAGIIGMKTGESKDLNLTFPEDYSDTTKAGKACKFTVTVNKVSRAQAEIDDTWVAANSDFTNVDEYRADLKTSLQTSADESNEQTMESDAWEQVFATATFTQYPQDMVDDWAQQALDTYQLYADQYGIDLDTMLSYYNLTQDGVKESSKSNVQFMLALDYIMDKEGVTAEDQVYTDKLNEILAKNSMTSKEEAIEAGVAECNIDLTVKYYVVMDIIKQYATITDVPEEETTEDTADATAAADGTEETAADGTEETTEDAAADTTAE